MDSFDIVAEKSRVRDLGINIDLSTLEVILISIIAERHLSVVTDNIKAVEAIIGDLIVQSWGFVKGEEFLVTVLNSKSEFDPTDIFGLPRLTNDRNLKLKPRIVVLEGLMDTSKKFQRDLDDYINEVASLWNRGNIFTIIVLGTNTVNSSLDEVLLDDIWVEHKDGDKLIETEMINLKNRVKNDLQSRKFTDLVIKTRENSQRVVQVREIGTYIYDIIIFVRTHRFVVDGLPTFVLGEFKQFLAIYATIHGYKYVIPEMVRQAAYLLLPIRIHMLKDPSQEPSIQYGSDLALVEQILDKVDIPIIIEEVMGKIQPPI